MSKDGCPCGGDCCDNPDTYNDHVCNENCEGVCEESYATYCRNCGKVCYCDL